MKDRRVPEGEHGKRVKTAIIILLNLVFAPSHLDVAVNKKIITTCSVVPPTDAALEAAGDVNADALDREGIRELSKQKREKERCSRNGMTIDDDGVAAVYFNDEEGALLAAMEKVKSKGGAMFAATAAAPHLNIGMLELTEVRELARQRLEQEHRGLGVPGDGRDLNDLPMDDADVIREMNGTRKPGGSFFAKSMELGNTNATLVHPSPSPAGGGHEPGATQNRGAIVLAEGRALFVVIPPLAFPRTR